MDLAKRYGPVVALDGATFTADPGRIVGFLGRMAPARRRRCAASSGSPGPTAATSAGRASRSIERPAPLRLHARAARPLPADAGRRAARLLRAAARDARPRRRCGRDALARPHGPGRSREVEARGPVARQPAARPARGRARPRPGAARPGRAVLRAGPDRHRHDDRGRPRARGGRRRRLFSSHQLDLVEDVCEDVVIIARGRIVAAGAIEELKAPRAGGTSRSRWSGPMAAGRWHGDSPSWSATATVQAAGGRRRRPRRLAGVGTAAGEVRRFAYQPRLSELFMEAVRDPADGDVDADRGGWEPRTQRSGSSRGARSSSVAAAADSSSRSFHDARSSSARSSCPRSSSTTTNHPDRHRHRRRPG